MIIGILELIRDRDWIMGLGIKDWKLGTRNGDWDWRFGFGFSIGDSNVRLGIKIRALDLALGN